MADENRNISNEVTDAILEKPIPFTIGDGRFFYLYQPSLGINLLAGQLLQNLQLNRKLLKTNKPAELLRVSEEQRDLVLRIVCLHTFSRRSEVLREEQLQKRIKELDVLSAPDIATLLVSILSWDGRQEKFMKHFKLNMERRTRQRIYEYKKSKGGSLTFGGRSLYGIILDAACERYGWEYGYTLWGISSLNLNMLLADSVQSVYLSKDEASEAHISTDGIYIDMSDPENARENARALQRLVKGK